MAIETGKPNSLSTRQHLARLMLIPGVWSSRSVSSANVRSGCAWSHCGRRWRAGASMREGLAPAGGLGSIRPVRRNSMSRFPTKGTLEAQQAGHRTLRADVSPAGLKDFLAPIS